MSDQTPQKINPWLQTAIMIALLILLVWVIFTALTGGGDVSITDNGLIIAALICFALDTFRVQTPINLTALGLFLWLLTKKI